MITGSTASDRTGATHPSGRPVDRPRRRERRNRHRRSGAEQKPELSRCVQVEPRVSLVVDDLATPDESVRSDGQAGRGLEIRATVDILVARQPLLDSFSNEVLRIHPHKIIAWNLDGRTRLHHPHHRAQRCDESVRPARRRWSPHPQSLQTAVWD